MLPRPFALVVAALLAAACARPVQRSGGHGAGAGSDPVPPLVQEPASVAAEGTLPLAAVFPTLGRYSVSGLQSLKGAQLAVEDLNRAGGIHGRPLRLAVYRTGSYFVDAHEAAVRAVAAGALAVVGSNSSELSQAVAEETEARGVLQVSNVSTAADLTWDPATGVERPFVFRMCATDDVMGALLAGFARDRLGARRAAVLYEVGRPYSARLARSFVRGFSDSQAGRVATEVHYLALETDFRPQLRLVKEFRPDVVFVPGSFPDATLVAVQARALGVRATWLGGDAWSSPFLFQRGAPPGPAYYVELCSPAPEFDRRYVASVGAEPPGCRAVLAYDAVRVIAAGLRSLGRLDDAALTSGLPATRRRLRDAVARAEVDGITGRVRFDVHGNRRQGVALYAVESTPEGPRALVRGWLGEP